MHIQIFLPLRSFAERNDSSREPCDVSDKLYSWSKEPINCQKSPVNCQKSIIITAL